VTTTTLPLQTPPGRTTAPRLGWLDALRGYAALVVVLFHLSPSVLGPERHLAIFRTIDLGKYGVLLFFLVSGYVIPMSLERHGSLRRFWIGRLFRIYPAYLFAAAFLIVCTAAVPAVLRGETVSSVLGHATMLSDPLGLRGAVRVFWTLSYEMVFYLVVAGLFAWRLHRHSGWWASGLAIVAAVAGPRLPDGLFSAGFTSRRVTAAVLLVLVVACVAGFLTGRTRLAGLIGIGFVLLIALNGHPSANSTVASSQQGLLLLAVMFAGTVVYRAQHGQLDRRAAATALAVTAGAVAWAAVAPLTAAAVVVTFAIAFALRARGVPRVLVWLGSVSYSLYLLHVIVLMTGARIVPNLDDRPIAIRLAVGALFLAAALGVAWLSYHAVELPARSLGRRIDKILGTQRALARTGRGENGTRSV
jgi:peptidoglycan/LPS O-acetylase OafA/YrhL